MNVEIVYVRGQNLKNVSRIKIYSILYAALLLTSCLSLASCFGDSSNTTASNTQDSAITPIGVPATCLTVHPPALVKLSDGHYKLIDEINNCGAKDAGPLDVTVQIIAGSATHNASFVGPSGIPANGKALYQTYVGRATSQEKEIDYPSPVASPANVMISVTFNKVVQGEWDGQVAIPA